METWGYKRDELNGKNVSMLMPNPFASKHNTFLRNYLTTGAQSCCQNGHHACSSLLKACFTLKYSW